MPLRIFSLHFLVFLQSSFVSLKNKDSWKISVNTRAMIELKFINYFPHEINVVDEVGLSFSSGRGAL